MFIVAVKYPKMYKGMYLGDMSPDTADLILELREMESIDNLKNMIFNFPLDLVLRSIEEERSIRSILREEGIDYNKYIGELRDYQTVGVGFMYMSKRSIIGDGVGMGKTVEIAGLLNFLRLKKEMTRFLMAVETSAVGQTQAELIKFTGMHIVQLPSESRKLKRAIDNIDWNTVDGIIIKHSTLRSDTFSKWLAINIKEDGTCRIFDTFILDESSIIKNSSPKISMYTRNICNLAKRIHFMNATVFETNIMDIYNQIDMLNPNLLPKKWRIQEKYCVYKRGTYWIKENGKPTMKYKWDLVGYKNQKDFKESLKLYYFGRSKSEVGLELEHQYKIYEVYPTNEQSLAIAKGYRYSEVLNCPSLIEELNISMNRKSVPKLDRLLNLIENDFVGSSIMIYSFYIKAQEVIYEELVKIGRKPVILNGNTKEEERWDIQNKFNKGEYDVIITNIQKSLNLYGADVCIFYTPLTNPSRLEQVKGRIDRSIDDRIKTFILLLYKGTDEYNFFKDIVKQRAKDAKDLILDAKTAVDKFIESLGG